MEKGDKVFSPEIGELYTVDKIVGKAIYTQEGAVLSINRAKGVCGVECNELLTACEDCTSGYRQWLLDKST